jgi:PhzF family phenazine biosynthesis protein
MQRLEYYLLDVFTETRYRGNPLSVVITGQALDVAEYTSIAREFGFSETSFIQKDDSNTVSVRSFTPAGVEVGGAGHNLLGAVSLSLLKGWSSFADGDSYSVVIGRERIKLEIKEENGNYRVTMKQQPAEIIANIPSSVIAPFLNLSEQELTLHDWQSKIVKTEVAHLMVPVSDQAALYKAAPDNAGLTDLSKQYGFEGYYLFTTSQPDRRYIAETRFFNPLIGIDDDAATGTAAGPLAGYLEQSGFIVRGKNYKILQGVSVQHPSELDVMVTNANIWVGGFSVIVMEGMLYL